jgi:hypothetical protein
MNINGVPTNPGDLRVPVILAQRNLTRQPGGAQVQAPTPIGTDFVYAKWENLHGSEVWQASSVNALLPATVTVRWLDELDNTCLVVKGGSLVDVVGEDGHPTGAKAISGGTVYEIVGFDNMRERTSTSSSRCKL